MLLTTYDLRDILHLLGLIYRFLFLTALCFVLVMVFRHFRGATNRIVGSVIGVAVVVGIFYGSYIPKIIREKAVHKKRIERYQHAKAIFDERCTTAGWKIYRRVENVEGVTLLKIRPETKHSDVYDPMWPDAALPHESRGDAYIREFLYMDIPKLESDGTIYGSTNGYRHVDVKENGQYIRYAFEYNDKNSPMIETVVDEPSRYAVTYENKVDPEDRKYWIAGTKVVVLDTQRNEILGEAVWYAFEPAQGAGGEDRNSGTPPWRYTHVKACPKSGKFPFTTRSFVNHVLLPPSRQPTYGESR